MPMKTNPNVTAVLDTETTDPRILPNAQRDWAEPRYAVQYPSALTPASLYAVYPPSIRYESEWRFGRPEALANFNAYDTLQLSAFPEYQKKTDAPSRDAITRAVPTIEADALTAPRAALAVQAEDLLGYATLRVAVQAPGALRRALAALEIQVLDQAAVDAYKEQMVRHYASHQKMYDPTWRLTSLRSYKQPVPEHVLAKAVEVKRALPQAEFYVDQLAVDPFLIVTLGPLRDSMVNTPSRTLDAETAAYIEVWDEPKFDETWEG